MKKRRGESKGLSSAARIGGMSGFQGPMPKGRDTLAEFGPDKLDMPNKAKGEFGGLGGKGKDAAWKGYK
jgi:hypothetical protein